MSKLHQRLSNLSPAKLELLARRLEEKRRASASVPAAPPPSIPRRETGDGVAPPPLSFAQERLWFLDRLDPGATVYNITTAVRVRGPLDLAALTQSLDEIVRRHEILRTTFDVFDGQPAQVVASALRVELPLIDLSGMGEAERERAALGELERESQRPFDLRRGPLLRALLLRLGAQEHVVQLMMHHIVSDAWSMSILVREMVTLYAAFSEGRPSPLPELPLQYADYAAWQRRWLSSEVLAAQLVYWRTQLGGVPAPLELPTDRPRPSVPSNRGETMQFVLSPELSEAVRALSLGEGVTLFMTLLAAFQVLLQRYTGQDDIVVGSNIAGRNRADIEGLIGFFINNVVLRTDLSGDPTFRELLGRVRDAALGAYAHQDVPFEKLVEELHPEREAGRSPLFQVMLVLQNAPFTELSVSGLAFTPFAVGNPTSKFDLTLFMGETPEGIGGAIEYSTDLYDASTIARMRDHFETLLAGIVAAPDQPIESFPLLSADESYALIDDFNA
ncbi:MAG: condensation domain-containing protein [Pyrinomonadaceae bacterium]